MLSEGQTYTAFEHLEKKHENHLINIYRSRSKESQSVCYFTKYETLS